jgi:hypothetical protein
MTVSPILEILAINEAQAQKATALNTAMGQLEGALADEYNFDTTALVSGNVTGTLPFDDAGDLTARTALRFVMLTLDAGATIAFNVIHPDNKHLFYVRNNTAWAATVKTAAGTGVTIPAGNLAIVYCDGTNVLQMFGGLDDITITQAEDYELSFYGTPTSSQVMAQWLAPREVWFNDNFVGSVGVVGTNPTSPFTITLKRGAATWGTITVATNGTFTWTTAGLGRLNVLAGTLMTAVAPAGVDATLADLNIMLVGYSTQAQ